ncbi:MAG: hypothetical protein RRB51_00005 [Thermoproteus sp.]|nr:hypothetical protein [Thermoproteus sp.]
MARTRWLLAVVLTLIAVAGIVLADVVFNYKGQVSIKPINSPITVVPGQCPCGCSSWSQTNNGFTATITGYTLSTTSGYVLTTPLVEFHTTTGGTLTMTLSPNTAVVSDYVNGAMIYPTPGSFSLGVGNYLLIQKLTINTAVSSTSITLSGQYNYTVGGVTFQYSFSETINPPSADVMNLLNGLQAFYVPHVYQGDINGKPTNSYPVYYGPSIASISYWGPVSPSINQPVLMMVPAQGSSAGAMFWSETYSGGSVTITLVGTFSSGSSPVADGYEIYLFLEPIMWGISSQYNYSISYISTSAWEGTTYPSPVEGDVILPQSLTPYIVVEWDPYWQFGYTTSGATGQWNVWIVSNPSGYNPSVSPNPSPNLSGSSSIGLPYAGWDGIGTGAFQPRPGDYICITVTYNPSTNTLSGVAYDLNTGQSASFTLNLGSYWTPPSSGNYIFGVGASTGGAYANWGVVYVNYQG